MHQSVSNEQLIAVANEFGTPVYVYDAEKIAEQYHKLSDAFSAHPTRFFYACKALTNVNILKYICSLGANVDCSSINEVKLALHAGFPKPGGWELPATAAPSPLPHRSHSNEVLPLSRAF